ncbi:hypothetical protein FRZ06_11435 [Anoxybacterium hadale]|uniref:Uncharacterized protein n=1 Tax=Anoxybacterium hadale TaxID=3408580 RepID=A0ACD1ACJ0_9FIRM|nr:hypothetical protein FRZ06_11435 [Clostridiales bacterium]
MRKKLDGTNTAFNDLQGIGNDEKWKDFSPQFVRTSLIKKLFNYGFSIEDIVYITGLPVENIGNYINTNQIIERKTMKNEKIKNLQNIFGNVLERTI